MKQKIKNSYAVVFSLALFSVSVMNAQDTVTVKKTTIDSVKVRTTIVNDTVVKPRAVAEIPVKAADERKLYLGEVGLHYLPTFTSVRFRNVDGDVIEGTATMGNGVGAMVGFNISKYVGVRLEVNYDQISQKYKDKGLEKHVSINYINVPLFLSINTDKTCPVVFGVMVGPQFGINIGSSMSSNGGDNTDTLQAELAVKQGDVGLAYGAGFGIALNKAQNLRLDFGFRGMFGLVNMDGTTTSDNSYNILVRGSRKAYGGYLGVAYLF